MPKNIDYCIDCGAVAEKYCLSCGAPLCYWHYKSQNGYCYDCMTDIEKYLEDNKNDNIGGMDRNTKQQEDYAQGDCYW